MSGGRLIQNLRGGRALIVAEQGDATAGLIAMLGRLGMTPLFVLPNSPDLNPARLDAERDVLLVDGDLSAGLALPLSPLAQLPPVPVIGLVGIEAPSRLRSLMTLGATAFLRKPVHHGSIYTALFLCVNEYRCRLLLERQLQELHHRRARRRFVIKAVLGVMRRTDVDEDAAYDALRRESMRARQSIEDYCEAHVLLANGPAADRIFDKEGDHALRPIAPAASGHRPCWAAEPGLDSGAGSRPDQARRA